MPDDDCSSCTLKGRCDPELCANEILAAAGHRLPNGQKDEGNRRRQTAFEEEIELGLATIPRHLPWRIEQLLHAY